MTTAASAMMSATMGARHWGKADGVPARNRYGQEFWSSYFWVNTCILILLMLQQPISMQSVDFGGGSSSLISNAPSYRHHSDYLFKFEYNSYNVTIPENSIGKTYVQQATDDLGRMGVRIFEGIDVKFRVTSGDKDKLFKIEERVVGDFAFVTLRTRTGNVVLNREKVDEYRLAVHAIGTRRNEKNSKLVMESDAIINVRVLDRNDLSPLFYPTDYSATVREDMELHKSILQVHAEDADLGINGEIYYSFYDKNFYEHLTVAADSSSSNGADSTSDGDDNFRSRGGSSSSNKSSRGLTSMPVLVDSDTDQFAINPISGVITLTRPLNFVDRPFYELVVIATDRGPHSQQQVHKRINHASKALIRINVTQVSWVGSERKANI